MNKEESKTKNELKEPELIKKAKNEIIEICPKCNGITYEVFAGRLWGCFKCNQNIFLT